MTEKEWQEQVKAAFETLNTAFATTELNGEAIAPLRGLVDDLDRALFRGFRVYYNERYLARTRALRIAKTKGPELSFEDLFS